MSATSRSYNFQKTDPYMQDLLNPALRLHILLKSALIGPSDESMLNIWANLFDLPDPTEVKVVRCIVAMADCLDETKRLLGTRNGINLTLFISEFPSIENALAPSNLRYTRAQVLTPHLQPTVLKCLEFCAEELRKFYIEESISDDDLAAIRKAADDIFEQIFNSTLDSELRRVLLEDIERLRASITLYRIRGAQGLLEAHRALTGAIAIQSDAIKTTSKENKPILVKLGQLVKQIDEVTSSAVRLYKSISSPFKDLLGLLGCDTQVSLPQLPQTDDDDHTEA
jgi:hypothetical protein